MRGLFAPMMAVLIDNDILDGDFQILNFTKKSDEISQHELFMHSCNVTLAPVLEWECAIPVVQEI